MTAPNEIVQQRVEALAAQLTLKEKVALLSGKDIWNTVPIERLNIPSVVMTDGPHGVRAADPHAGRTLGTTTAFPTGISMSASWNPDLVEKVGEALGEETRGMNCDILLGPCVNIVRHPLGGRNFETYSEDPYLAGRIGVAYVKGVQSKGVGTSLKHYALNNYEIERFRASTRVDERTMREIYLPAFETIVKETQPWTVMCSYNRINGIYAGENDYLLNKILRDEWGFEGAVISDWSATHTVFESVQNGLDLEMPGPARYFRLLEDAVNNWQVDPKSVEKAVRRVLGLVVRSGRLDGALPKGAVNTPEHQALARHLAEEAITLLKNEGGILPLEQGKISQLALIGPNAAEAAIEGGGSSRVEPPYKISPLDGVKSRLGEQVEIRHEPGCDNVDEPVAISKAWLVDDAGNPGMRAAFYATADLSGDPAFVQDGNASEFWFHTGWSEIGPSLKGIRWSGSLRVPADADYQFVLYNSGAAQVFLDGEQVLSHDANERSAPASAFAIPEGVKAVKKLQAGRSYDLRVELVRHHTEEVIAYRLGMGLHFPEGLDPRLAQAVDAAQSADVAIVFAGYPDGFETEGTDRPHMRLPGGQNELIEAVASVNQRTVVVLNVGAPIEMPWVDKVAAIVLAYYPGLENGNAVAKVLLGEVNPSGKLPITLPRRLQDSPAFINASYPGCREVNYGEGIFVGYRYFDKVELEPLFPFGHGLSYTRFEYSDLKLPEKVSAGQPVEVSVVVKNVGQRAGQEVAQLYVTDPQSSMPRPPRELKRFAKVALQPGESKVLQFSLDQRALAFYDPNAKAWVAEPGVFEVQVGGSSRHIGATGSFVLL